MTVKELKEALEGCPEDLLVVLAGDPEGNSFRTVAAVEGPLHFQADYNECYPSEERHEGTKPCVVIWP